MVSLRIFSAPKPTSAGPSQAPAPALPAATVAEIERRFAADKPVQIVEVRGQPLVIKTPQARGKSRFAAGLIRLASSAIFGESADTAALRRRDAHYEVRRLQNLAASHQPVPGVVLETDRYFVTEYRGQSVDTVLHGLTGPHKRQLLADVVQDLAGFHAAGHWHGGAQLRNLTLCRGKRYRIDFEERIGDAVSLHLAQAFDVALLFTSMADMLDPGGSFGAQLLVAYLEAWPSAKVAGDLMRLNRILPWALRVLPWMGQGIAQRKEAYRALVFQRVLRGALG